jgi:hypothetical protein
MKELDWLMIGLGESPNEIRYSVYQWTVCSSGNRA